MLTCDYAAGDMAAAHTPTLPPRFIFFFLPFVALLLLCFRFRYACSMLSPLPPPRTLFSPLFGHIS